MKLLPSQERRGTQAHNVAGMFAFAQRTRTRRVPGKIARGSSVRRTLQAVTQLIDQTPDDDRAVLLARYRQDFKPQNDVEEALVESMALARWRMALLWKLEASAVHREVRALRFLWPGEDSLTLLAFAFASLNEDGRALDVFDHLEARFHARYRRSRARLMALRSALSTKI